MSNAPRRSLAIGGHARSSDFTAIICKVLSAAALACMFALIKSLEARYPVGQLVFFRSFFAMPPVICLLMMQGGLGALRTRRPEGHLGRSVFGLGSLFFSFAAFSLLPLATATAIGYAAPLLIVLLARPVLGEPLLARNIFGALAGFLGVLVMLRPEILSLSPGAAYALAGAVMLAFALMSIRGMAKTETSGAIAFYFALAGTVVGAATLPFGAIMPSMADWPALVLIGLLGGIAQILLTKAYHSAPASVVAPFEYVTIVFAAILGFAFWGEIPTLGVVAGILLIVAANLALILSRNAPQPVAGRSGSRRSGGAEP